MRSRLVRTVAASCAATLLAFMASCSGPAPGGRASETAARSLFQVCSGGVPGGWTRVTGAPGNAVAKGQGAVVVLVNDLTNSVCGWIPMADRLVALHRRVVLFQYADTTPEGEARSVARTLAVAEAAAGNKPYALVGANFGGRIVIEAAAQHPDGLRAIVSVSGEVEDNAWHNILAEARAVTTPALYVGTRHDAWTDGTGQQRMLHHAMHGSPNQLVQYPGNANGMALVDPVSAKGQAMGVVVTFVSRLLPSAHG